MNLSESYKKRLQELANINTIPQEEVEQFNKLIKEFIERVPVLKSYKKFERKYDGGMSVTFQKDKNYGESTLLAKNKTVYFKDYVVFSELTISYKHFNEYKWYFIKFNNQLQPILDDTKELDNVFNQVFTIATKMVNEKFSFEQEIKVKEENDISPEQVNMIIQELNKITFDFEDYLLEQFNYEFFE